MKFDEVFEEVGQLSAEEAQAISRVSFGDSAEDASSWIADPAALLRWLVEHPGTTAEVGRWSLTLHTPRAEDLVGLGHFDPPSGLEVAVEEHSTSQDAEGFSAWWAFG
jgi:hypothetical protein